MVKKITFIFLAVLYTMQIAAQETWSLEDCITHALSHNLQVKQQELNISQTENILLQSKLSLLPNASASTSYNIGWGRTLNQNNYQYENSRTSTLSPSVSASMTLFAGLQRQNTIKKSKLDLQAAQQDVEKYKNDISLSIAAAYLQILLDEERLVVASDQLKTTEEQLKKTKILVDAGSTTMSTYLELQAQQATEEMNVVVAQNNISVSYLNLKQLLDLQTSESFKINNPQIDKLPEIRSNKGINQIFDDNVSLRPEVKSAEYRLQSLQRQLQINKGAYYPSLSVGGGVNTRYVEISNTNSLASISNQLKDNVMYSLGFSLSIPIFNGFQTRTNVRNTELNVRSAELQLQQTKNTLYKEIQQAEVDAEAALQRYHAAQKNVTALEESFRYVDQKFNVGMVSTTDYNVAKTNLSRAQSELIQAKYQFIFQSKILEFHQGIPLTL